MREHKFRRRGGFDSRQIFTVSTYEGEMGPSFARRHWEFTLEIPSSIAQAKRAIQQAAYADGETQSDIFKNRVINFRQKAESLQPELFMPHTQDLRSAFGASSKAEVDRAMWLVCHEIEFHEDILLADSSAFLIWHVGAPAKAVDFPNLGFGVMMETGDALLFDGMQPHGVRQVSKIGQCFGRNCQAVDAPAAPDEITVFLPIDAPLTPELPEKMGIIYGTSTMLDCVSASVDEAPGESTSDFGEAWPTCRAETAATICTYFVAALDRRGHRIRVDEA